MKKLTFILLAFLCIAPAYARKSYDRGIVNSLFVPKGTWMGGTTFSYTEMNGDDYQFLVLDNINADGYTFKVSPYAGYFLEIIWQPGCDWVITVPMAIWAI